MLYKFVIPALIRSHALPLPLPLFLPSSIALLLNPLSALTPPPSLGLALVHAFLLGQKMYSKFGISAMTCFRGLALAFALISPLVTASLYTLPFVQPLPVYYMRACH